MLRFMTALMGRYYLCNLRSPIRLNRKSVNSFWLSWAGRRCGVDDADRPEASNEALIQVSHVDNDIDGQIFAVK